MVFHQSAYRDLDESKNPGKGGSTNRAPLRAPPLHTSASGSRGGRAFEIYPKHSQPLHNAPLTTRPFSLTYDTRSGESSSMRTTTALHLAGSSSLMRWDASSLSTVLGSRTGQDLLTARHSVNIQDRSPLGWWNPTPVRDASFAGSHPSATYGLPQDDSRGNTQHQRGKGR